MLDANGTLLRCAPQFVFTCDVQRILESQSWKQPAAMTIWDRKLYILDSEAGQIWRYDPSGSTYVSAPREYFAGSARPNLRNVADFTIAGDGHLYLLYRDGVMKRYFGGSEVAFTFSGFNEGSEPSVVQTEAFYLNDSPFAPGFFLISRGTRSIFETTAAGTFMDSFQAFDQQKLELMSAVVAYPEQNILYVASGNTIFSITMDFTLSAPVHCIIQRAYGRAGGSPLKVLSVKRLRQSIRIRAEQCRHSRGKATAHAKYLASRGRLLPSPSKSVGATR